MCLKLRWENSLYFCVFLWRTLQISRRVDQTSLNFVNYSYTVYRVVIFRDNLLIKLKFGILLTHKFLFKRNLCVALTKVSSYWTGFFERIDWPSLLLLSSCPPPTTAKAKWSWLLMHTTLLNPQHYLVSVGLDTHFKL